MEVSGVPGSIGDGTASAKRTLIHALAVAVAALPASLSIIAFPPEAKVLEIGCGTRAITVAEKRD